MRKEERRNIKALERRIKHLESRIDEAEGTGLNLSYDKTELHALRWAVSILWRHFQ